MIPRHFPAFSASIAALLFCLSSCGGGGSSSPSTPTTPPPTTPPTTQPPSTTNPPLSATCARLGLGTSTGHEVCRPEGETFLANLDLAIDRLIAEQPQIFDLNSYSGAGGYRVLSEGAYFVGVIQNLDKQGYCAGLYGEELAITNVKDYSENYDILDAKSYARRGLNSYRSTCTPASYTIPVAFPGNSPGCSIAASASVACTREVSGFGAVVAAALDQITQEHPEFFDFHDVQPGGDPNWYRVNVVDGYVQGVVKILLAKGVCARWDGEELNVKTNNVSSENYDILTSKGYMRRGDGSYRVTCYPAYF
jgi:hypothetical protein